MKSIHIAGCWLNIISIGSTLTDIVLYMDILQIQLKKKDISAYLVEPPFLPSSINLSYEKEHDLPHSYVENSFFFLLSMGKLLSLNPNYIHAKYQVFGKEIMSQYLS